MPNQLAERKEQGLGLAYMGNQEEMEALAKIAIKVAPWAGKTKDLPAMTGPEVSLVVGRAASLGADPLNPHEIQINRDKKGVIQVKLSYTLIIEWVNRFKGEHTNPQYYRLTEEQLIEEGLEKGDVAFRCEVFRVASFKEMDKRMESPFFTPEQVYKMFAITGIGVAKKEEYNKWYFAPNARTPSWKVQKRALEDAYRKKYGTPSRAEVIQLRRMLGHENIQPQDWENTSKLAPGDAVALADARANERQDAEEFEQMTDDEKAEVKATNAATADALWGETPSAIVDIEAEDVEEEEYTGVPDQLDNYPEIPEGLTRDEAADKCRDLFSALRDSGVVALLSPDFTLEQFYLSSLAMEEALEDLTNGTLAAEVQVYLTAGIEKIKNIIEEAQ